jgi:hypothetical protein
VAQCVGPEFKPQCCQKKKRMFDRVLGSQAHTKKENAILEQDDMCSDILPSWITSGNGICNRK